MTMIRSQAVLDSSRGQTCTMRLPSICNGNAETTVWCHLNGHRFGKGAGIKAHDVLGFHGCSDCHRYYDVGHGTKPLMTEAELIWAVLGAVTETWVRLIQLDVIKVPENRVTPANDQPVKPRKPRAQRAKVPNNPDRKIPSRPMRQKERT